MPNVLNYYVIMAKKPGKRGTRKTKKKRKKKNPILAQYPGSQRYLFAKYLKEKFLFSGSEYHSPPVNPHGYVIYIKSRLLLFI